MNARRRLIQIFLIAMIAIVFVMIAKTFFDQMDGTYDETDYAPLTNDSEQVDIIGKKVIDFYHEPEGNYYVIEFDDGTKTGVRFVIKNF